MMKKIINFTIALIFILLCLHCFSIFTKYKKMHYFNENNVKDVVMIYDQIGRDPLRIYNYKPKVEDGFNLNDKKVLEFIKNTVVNFILIGEDSINNPNEKQNLISNLNKIDSTWSYKFLDKKYDNLIFLLLQNSDNTVGYMIEIQKMFWRN